MNVTRRGLAVIALLLVSTYMAYEYGPRSLNAVVAPAVVALGLAFVQVRLIDPPTVDRTVPDPGVVDGHRTVTLSIETDSAVGATVHDHVRPGLDGLGNQFTTTLGGSPVTYDVRLDERGEHELGPLTVEVTDVLGLVRQRYRYDGIDTVVAYPRVYRLDPQSVSVALPADQTHGREEFDHLREYRRGDSAAMIDWKSTAKRADDGFLVSEYRSTDERRSLWVALRTDGARLEDAIEATASVVVHLLDRGFEVGLSVPGDAVEPGAGATHRHGLLAVLARVSAESVAARSHTGDVDRADVVVTGDGSAVTIDTGTDVTTFGEALATYGGDPIRHETPVTGDDQTPVTAGAATDTRGVVQ